MKKERIGQRIAYGNVITAVLSAAVILLSGSLSIYRCFHTDIQKYDNQVRLLVSRQNQELVRGNYGKGTYPYLVLDLTGKVLYSDCILAQKNQMVNVQEMLQIDKSFAAKYSAWSKEAFVLEQDGRVIGFAVYLIPAEETGQADVRIKMMQTVLPLGIGSLITLVLVLTRLWYCNRRVLCPIRKISHSAREIMQGNYDYEVQRVYEMEAADNEMGELTYFFELMRDELKNRQIKEEAMKKSQQELISCISHDLKTPLSTIKAYAEGMRDGIARTQEMRERYTRIIIEKTDLLIGMIGELLKFSNAQLNQLEIKLEECYIKPYFEKAMQELELYVSRQNVEFHSEFQMEDMIVRMDEKRITEVLYNLVENSIKYRKENGSIKITARRWQNQVLIQVVDDGIGIHSDDIPYVFDRFYRAEKSRTSSVAGAGLGLSICKYIVEQHGGEIYCHSRKEEGCEIGFYLRSS